MSKFFIIFLLFFGLSHKASLAQINSKKLILFTQNYLWGYEDEKGNIQIPAKFEWANEFSEGLAWVSNNGVYCFINEDGTIVIDSLEKEYGSFYAKE